MVKAIRARPQVTAFTSEGKKVFGVPVTDREWMSLPSGTYVVLVDSVGEDGKATGPREWFRVAKTHGRTPWKDFAKPVMAEQSKTKAAAIAVKPMRTGLVEKRPHHEYVKFTDDVDPQWKAVVKRCGSDVIYALSPQAKGKIERPYQWMQDRLVRTAAKEKLTTLDEIRDCLRRLIDMYNTKWVHSTTKEIPIVRFENALNGNCSLFKPLTLAVPNANTNDLFCLSFKRTTDGYRSLSFDGVLFRLPNAKAYTETEIHIAPDLKKGLATVRFWQEGRFVEEHTIKLSQLKALRF